MIGTYEPIIEVIEEDYEIPHLGATRRISALLPGDYYDSEKSYPVLYLQDGQNLFNPSAPFGDWAIDKSMRDLAAEQHGGVIIIAVNHGEEERIKEYLPYDHYKFGKGKGQFYIQFMKEKLIPYVNRKYRTLTGYEHTGIGGSSMGGLISLYAGLTEPNIFGRLMIFSPSLWLAKKIFFEAMAYHPLTGTRCYIYAGGNESKMHLPNVKKLAGILEKKASMHDEFNFHFSINDEGMHQEYFWGQEFPDSVRWLYFNKK